MGSLHTVRFPGESEQYRQARDELLAAEVDLRRQLEAIAAQRRSLPLGGEIRSDYEFEEWDSAAVLRGESGSRSCLTPARTRCSCTASCGCRSRRGCRSSAHAPPARRSSMESTAPCRTSPSGLASPSPLRLRSINSVPTASAGGGATPGYSQRCPAVTASTTRPRTPRATSGRWPPSSRAVTEDPSFLEQRAVDGRTRRRSGSAARRFHVAPVVGIRPRAGWPG